MLKMFEDRKVTIVLVFLLVLLLIVSVLTFVNKEDKEAFNEGNTIVEQVDPTTNTDSTETETETEEPVPADENTDAESSEVEKPTEEETEEGVTPSPSEGNKGGSEKPEGEDTKPKDEGKGNNEKGVVTLVPKAQLPDLTLESQKPFEMDYISGLGTSMLTPVYHDTFRYQIREFTGHPARLVIDIGNTGGETLVITDDNFYFSIYDREGNEIAGSKVQGAPIHIAPGEIKRVVVTAQNPDAGVVHLMFGGMDYTLVNPFFLPLGDEAADVVDTTPYHKYGYSVKDENGASFIIAEMAKQVIGNGKAKMVVNGLTIVENERVGPIDKGEGFLALVRVKIANTSNEVMTIDKILVEGGGARVEFKTEELAVLGDKALPSTIKPNSIVEGWIPFRVGDGKDGHGVVLYTNLGGFIFTNLQAYPIF